MVYKLVNLKGEARIKKSEEAEKTTLPGCKSTLRVYLEHSSTPAFDLLCLESEAA